MTDESGNTYWYFGTIHLLLNELIDILCDELCPTINGSNERSDLQSIEKAAPFRLFVEKAGHKKSMWSDPEDDDNWETVIRDFYLLGHTIRFSLSLSLIHSLSISQTILVSLTLRDCSLILLFIIQLSTNLSELESYINSLENTQSPKLQEFREHFKSTVLPTLFEQQRKMEIAARRMKRLAAIGINKKNILQGVTQRERRRPTTHDGMIDVDAIDVRRHSTTKQTESPSLFSFLVLFTHL